jgi:hypothetical protein
MVIQEGEFRPNDKKYFYKVRIMRFEEGADKNSVLIDGEYYVSHYSTNGENLSVVIPDLGLEPASATTAQPEPAPETINSLLEEIEGKADEIILEDDDLLRQEGKNLTSLLGRLAEFIRDWLEQGDEEQDIIKLHAGINEIIESKEYKEAFKKTSKEPEKWVELKALISKLESDYLDQDEGPVLASEPEPELAALAPAPAAAAPAAVAARKHLELKGFSETNIDKIQGIIEAEDNEFNLGQLKRRNLQDLLQKHAE